MNLNPFSIIPDLLLGLFKLRRDDRYYKAACQVALTTYVTFLGTLGVTGGATLAATRQPFFALTTAFFAACLVTAGAVLRALQQSGVWQDVKGYVPAGLASVIEGSDVASK